MGRSMGIKIKLDTMIDPVEVLGDLESAEQGAALVEGITDAVYQDAWENALRLGSSFGPRIARSLRTHVAGLTGWVAADGADGYVGLHVHRGGVVRSRNGKTLAIPTRYNREKELFARNRSDLVLIKSKKRNRCYLFKRLTEPGEVLGKPLYVLTRETKPQKPRPWWPEEDRVRELSNNFVKENF